MVTGTAKIVVDLGNSETRVKTYYGKTPKGNPRCRLSVLSNRYARVPQHMLETYIEEGNYSQADSCIFEVNGDFYCNGRLCANEFAQKDIAPSAIEKKYNSFVTKLALINALHEGYMTVADLANCDVNNLDIDLELYLLLPPEDVSFGAKKLSDMARSITEIKFFMPEMRKEVKIASVRVLPEGLCAFIGTVFQSKGAVRNGYAHLMDNNESTLVIDIGAGTTDFVLVRGASVVQTSLFTRPIGGNNVSRMVQKSLSDRGLNLPVNIISRGCEVGYVITGSKKVDITENIAEAKQYVSSQLVNAVQAFFESSMIDINTINNILVCGGGAEIPEEGSGVEPISTYILEYIRQLCPYIQLIEIPYSQKDGERVRISPRMLNITGAGILAE